MQSITLDSYSLHSLTVAQSCMVGSVTGLGFPDVRVDSYNRAGTHGQTIAHNLYGGRLITIQGTIRGTSAATYLANRQGLEAAVSLQLDANNVPVARTLGLIDNNYNAYSVNVVTKAFVCEVTSPTVAKWQLQLMATDYTVSSASTSSFSMGLPVSGGVTFPVTFPISFGSASGGTATAASAGNAPAYPVITISGPCINPVIANDSTGAHIGFSLTMVAGDTLTIRCQSRTAVQGASTNRMGSITTGSTFFSLLPGNNTLRFSADAYDSGTATVTWADQFLGV